MLFILTRTKEVIIKAWQEHGDVLPATIEIDVPDVELPETIRELYTDESIDLTPGHHNTDGRLRYYKTGGHLKTELNRNHSEYWVHASVSTEHKTYGSTPTPEELFGSILATHAEHKAKIGAKQAELLQANISRTENWLAEPDFSDSPRMPLLSEDHPLRSKVLRAQQEHQESRARAWIERGENALADSDHDVDLYKVLNSAPSIGLLPEHHPILVAVADLKTRLSTEDRLRSAAKREREKAAEKQYEVDREAWIHAHGSTRLRLLLEEGIKLDNTYRDERLRAERPGFVWYREICGKLGSVRDACETTLETLRRVRQTVSDVRLEYLRDAAHVEGCKHQEGYDYDGPLNPFKPTAVLVAEFLGATIVQRIHPEDE